MYPAGRILHLVPARLVFDAEELAKLGQNAAAADNMLACDYGFITLGYTSLNTADSMFACLCMCNVQHSRQCDLQAHCLISFIGCSVV